jgi:large subunit ribosomal protein L4
MKAPIFKGGGVVGGPKPAEHRLSISKTQKKLSFLSAIAQQLHAGVIATLSDDAASVKPNTKQFTPLMKAVQGKKDSVLVVAVDAKAEGLVKSLRNMAKVRATHMGELNAYDILDADKVLFVAQAFDLVQKMFTK